MVPVGSKRWEDESAPFPNQRPQPPNLVHCPKIGSRRNKPKPPETVTLLTQTYETHPASSRQWVCVFLAWLNMGNHEDLHDAFLILFAKGGGGQIDFSVPMDFNEIPNEGWPFLGAELMK